MYKTVNETFAEITYRYDCFNVKEKSGRTLFYTPFKVRDSGNGLTTLLWLLEEINDINGNVIWFCYNKNSETGEYYLISIKYSANINQTDNGGSLINIHGLDYKNKIEFTYSNNRPDTRIGYVAGSKVTQSKLLSEINTYSNGTLQRKYSMQYTYDGIYSKLKQVNLTTSGGAALNPTLIDWGTPNNQVLKDNRCNMFGDTGSTDKIFFCDVDNDGVDEIIKPMRAGIGGTIYYNAKCLVYKYNKSTNALEYFSEFSTFPLNLFNELEIPSVTGSEVRILSSDNDNDGINDIIICKGEKYDDNKWYYHFIFNASSQQTVEFNLTSQTVQPMVMAGDFYPDGETDVLINSDIYTINYSTGKLEYKIPLSFTPVAGRTTDINGNGLKELWSATAVYEFDENTQRYLPLPIPYKDGDTGDFNGDGKTDILQYSNNRWHLFLSTGQGFDEILCPIMRMRSIDSGYSTVRYTDSYLVSDFNGDGYDDIAEFYEAGATKYQQIYYSTGSGFSKVVYPPSSMAELYHFTESMEGYRTLADIDGDGIDEIIHFGRTGFSSVSIPAPGTGLRMHEVTNGMGVKENIHYVQLTHGAPAYTKGENLCLPGIVRTAMPLYVADKLTVSCGDEAYSTLYAYEGLLYHKVGKGLLGFEKLKETNGDTGAYTLSVNKPDVQFSFLYPKSKTVYAPDGNAAATFKYEYKTTPLGGKRFFTYLYEEIQNDLLKDITVTSRNNRIDAYGNITEHITLQGGVTTEVKTQYGAHGSWCSNHPESITTTVSDGTELYTRKKTFAYDAQGRLTEAASDPDTPHSITTAYGDYDAFGHPLTVRVTAADKNGQPVTRTERKTYTPSGRFVATSTDVLGQVTTFSTNEITGLPISATNAAQQITAYEYDGMGNLTKTVSPDGNTTLSNTFWTNGAESPALYAATTQTSGAAPVTMWYDWMGREILTETTGLNGKKIRVRKEYYTAGAYRGQLKRVSAPYFADAAPAKWAAEYTAYDIHRRLTSVTTPQGVTSTAYAGRTVTVTSPAGVSVTVLNAQGLTESVTTHGKKVSYTYYAHGLPRTATPEGGKPVTMQYDPAGRRVKTHDPDVGTVTEAYDGFGQPVRSSRKQTANADSVITTLTYSAYGLLTDYTCGTRAAHYTYDTRPGYRSLITQMEIPGTHQVTFTYDAYGRPVGEQHRADGRTFTFGQSYTPQGQPARKTYPTGYHTDRQYDANGCLTQITDAAGRVIYRPLDADAEGRLTALARGSKTTAYGYDIWGHNTSIQAPGIIDYTYTYTAAGDMLSRTDGISAQQEVFTHDAAHRLTAWDVYKNGAVAAHNAQVYDAGSGNILSRTGLDNLAMKYEEPQGKPHALSSIAGVPAAMPAHDMNITYTAFNKISTLAEGASRYEVTYGVDNERLISVRKENNSIKETRIYLGSYEEVTDGAGNTKKIHYLSGGAVYIEAPLPPQGGAAGVLYYGYTDNQGSLIALTDQNGNAIERYAYDPWGARRNPQDWTLKGIPPSGGWGAGIINRGYTGHEHLSPFGGAGGGDIINMNGRVYDPLTAQFFSPDPVLHAGNWLNYNRYLYCDGNPLAFTDPSGYEKRQYEREAPDNQTALEDFVRRATRGFSFSAGGGGYGDGFLTAYGGMNLGPSPGAYTYNWAQGEYLNKAGGAVSYAEVYSRYIAHNTAAYYNVSSLYGFFDHLALVRTYDGKRYGLAGALGGKITGVQEGLFTVTNGGHAAMIATGNAAVETWGKNLKEPNFEDIKVNFIPDYMPGYFYNAGHINITKDIYMDYYTNGLNSKGGLLLMHEYGHRLQEKNSFIKFNYLIAPASLFNAMIKKYDEYIQTWTEIDANQRSYEYFGYPNYWDFQNYPIMNFLPNGNIKSIKYAEKN